MVYVLCDVIQTVTGVLRSESLKLCTFGPCMRLFMSFRIEGKVKSGVKTLKKYVNPTNLIIQLFMVCIFPSFHDNH